MKNYITRAFSVIMSIIICISFTFGGNVMAIAETISGDASSDASSNAVSVDTDINNDVYTFKDKNAGVKVLVAKKDSWNDGYVADISIENTGSESLSNWHIDLKVKGDIDSVWNSEYEVKDGKVTLSYPTWKRKISAGETYTIGMKVNGTFGDFEDFSYYEDAKDVSELYKIEYKVRNTWSHHAIIDAVITNTGETTLRDWSLVMDYDADIIDIWNADVVSNEGGSYRLKCKDYNADIEPDESVTFGFQAQYEGAEVILPINSKLIAVADSKLVPTKTDKADWYKVMTNADSDEATRMRDRVKDRVKVAIIDSGVDYMGEGDEINRVDFIGDTDEENPLYDDRSGHGTGVAGMLVGVGSIEEDEEEEDTTEAEASDMDFSYLTDADYIEAVDVEDEEDLDEENEEDYDDEDYDEDKEDLDDEDYDDSEVYEDDEDYDDYDIEDELEENDVTDYEEGLEDEDNHDDEDELDDDLNLFEYNDLYGDIEGLNPNIDLTSLRVLDEYNEAPVSRVIEAIEWAIDNDINILNLSWGVDKDNAELHNVIKRAYNKGMLIIAAAGNDGSITYPAKYDEVIAVGSVDSMAKIASDSASGEGIELVAPAEDVIAYTSFGILIFTSGTSFAAPQVTALASILWQQDITVSNKCIRELLRQSASPLGDTNCYGYGIIDYEKAAGMYEEFVRDYVDTDNTGTTEAEETAEVSLDEAEEVTTVDEEYVKGLWGPHNKMASGNAKADVIQVLRAGLMWPDIDDGLKDEKGKIINTGIKGMSKHPEFHGAGDYVYSYIYIMKKAKIIWNTGKWDNSSDKINKDLKASIGNYKKKYKALEKSDKKNVYISSDARKTITDKDKITSKKGKKYTAIFIMGIAMHTLGDVYAHQAYGLKEPREYYIGSEYNSYKYKGMREVNCNSTMIPKRYVKIIHGIRRDTIKKRIKSVNDKKLLEKWLDKAKGDYVDNRADSILMSEKRYSYTKKVYRYIINNKVNKSKKKKPLASDFISCPITGITASPNLKERVQSMAEHFGIDNLKKYINNNKGKNEKIDSKRLKLIDAQSIVDEYNKWQEYTLTIDTNGLKSIDRVDVCYQAKDGYVFVGSTSSGDGSIYSKNTSKKNSYSFIGDVGKKYVVEIYATDKDDVKIKATKTFGSKKRFDYKNEKKNPNKIKLHLLSTGEEYKVSIMKLKAKDRPNYYTFYKNKEISLNSVVFEPTPVAGYIKQCKDYKPVGGAKVDVYDVNDNNGLVASAFSTVEGKYIFSKDLYPGVYKFVISKNGYKSEMARMIIKSGMYNWLETLYLNYDDSSECTLVDGTITDSVTEKAVAGLDLYLIKGKNNVKGKVIARSKTTDNGAFLFKNLEVGYYTVIIKDNRTVDSSLRYLDGIMQFVAVPGVLHNQNGIVTNQLDNKQVRFVLTWGKTPRDLDSHLYFSDESGHSYHCYYSNKIINDKGKCLAKLDVDNTSSYGPETTTVYNPGNNKYKFTVFNFTGNSQLELSKSDALVQIYIGASNLPSYIFPVPQESGRTWEVVQYNGETGGITPINKVY